MKITKNDKKPQLYLERILPVKTVDDGLKLAIFGTKEKAVQQHD